MFVLLRLGRRIVERFLRSFEGDFGFSRLALAVSLNGEESSKLERFVGPNLRAKFFNSILEFILKLLYEYERVYERESTHQEFLWLWC